MSNRSETTEYNLLYEEDAVMEFDPWEQDLGEVEHFLEALKENPTEADAVAQAIVVKRTRVTFTTDWEPLTPPPQPTVVEAAAPDATGEAAPEPLFEIRDTKGIMPPIKNLLPVRGREAAERHAAHLNRSYYWGKTRFEIFEVEDIGQPVQPANRVPK
jgi:hypothetical protein